MTKAIYTVDAQNVFSDVAPIGLFFSVYFGLSCYFCVRLINSMVMLNTFPTLDGIYGPPGKADMDHLSVIGQWRCSLRFVDFRGITDAPANNSHWKL